ncbi:hypothetical protein GCM10011369_27990 [Neiella marina]|uniref:Polysaccharide biosynthesis protein C-terminal domain-containing protein n=2 Tax=Neiella marina TaxID=508461 RepID=A0A8J2U7I6_9GAMM|nr:hypothetical protein GCM10011369_27990 [Neiella marina]
MGFGAWSLVIGRISQSVFSAVITSLISDFKANYQIKTEHVEEIRSFGTPLFMMAMLTFFSGKTINLVVGAFYGASAFALLSMAKKGIQIFIDLSFKPINKILVATLARVEDSERVDAFYRTVSIAAFAIVPAYLGLGAVAEPFIMFFVGEKWQSSILLMTICCLGGPAAVMGYFLPNLMVASGVPKVALKLKITTLSFALLAPVLTIPYGIVAMMSATVVSTYISLPIRFYFAAKHTNVSLKTTFIKTLPFSLSSLLMFAAVKLMYHTNVVSELNLIIQLFLGVFVGGATYIALMFIFCRAVLYRMINEIRSIKG